MHGFPTTGYLGMLQPSMNTQLIDAIRSIAPSYGRVAAYATSEYKESLLSELTVEERVLASRYKVASRRSQFCLGRLAARKALAELVPHAVEIGRGARGQPVWPSTIVGTIAHTKDVVGALVASAADCRALGMDLEERQRQMRADISRYICTKPELDWVQQADSSLRTLMIFSAKEALYKALYPPTGTFFGFADATLQWRQSLLAFEATLHKTLSEEFVSGMQFLIRTATHQQSLLSICAVDRS